ncbi:hypothetical protein CK203_054790 [Vitis vinifera]|uniref:Uncharacterized protein n=1 Tax=Vitis vinifera TaxID=29760 RepID=A0A438GIM5_VITVI|nr:hypothetical protein CK203_054790 [Vitis vinifera]
MIVFPDWVSCKGEEATPNGVRGWGVGGTHKGGESRAPTSDQDRRAFAGACARVMGGSYEGREEVSPLPFPSAPADRRSDPPIVRYRPSKSTVTDLSRFFAREIFPHFKTIGTDAKVFRAPRPSYGPKRLSSLVSPSVRRKDDPSPPLRSSRRDSRFEKKNCPETLPEGPRNHLASSRFHASPIHPLKSRSNPNPCTKTRIQPYGSKEASILRGAHRPIWTNIPRYSHHNTSVKTNFSPDFLLSSTPEVSPQSHEIRELGRNNMTGAIIPALMHRIPSELRS